MGRRLLGGLGALAVAGVATFAALDRSDDASPARSWRRGSAKKKPLLSLLSPPGAGYDATNVSLSTGSGGAVTVTRASTQTCEVTPGVLTSVAADKPCVESGALKVEPSGTNLLLWSDDLSNAAWSSGGTPVVATNTWDYGLGAVGDTITDDDPAGTEGKSNSFTTSTTGAYTASCYLQSGSLSSVRLAVAVTGGTGTTTCTFTDLSTATQRKTCTATAGAGVTAVALAVNLGTTTADTGSIKVGGCQLETGSVATSYIPTTTATASRAAQTTTVPKPAALSTTEGCAKVCATPFWTGAASWAAAGAHPFILNADDADTSRIAYMLQSGDIFSAYNGTTQATVAANNVSGVRQCYRTTWSVARNQLRVENLTTGTVGTAVAFSGWPALDPTIALGSRYSASQSFLGRIDSIQFGTSPDACR